MTAAPVAEHPGHHHGHGHGGGPPSGRVTPTGRARTTVIALTVLATLASFVGMALLWPPAGTMDGIRAAAGTGWAEATTARATVLATTDQTCPGTALDRLPDGTVPSDVLCPVLRARVDTGAQAGEVVEVPVPAQVVDGGLEPGDAVRLARYPAIDGQPASWSWLDFSRTRPLAVLVGAFVLLTAVVGRRRGLAALGGMALAGVVLSVFMVPALLAGEPPVLVALSGCTAIMSVVLYATHGFSLRTAAAHLGTVGGLVLVAGAAWAAVGATHLQGLNDEDSAYLGQLTSVDTLTGLVLAGVVLAGVGVLNDVTITQASAVWEVREHAPDAGFRLLLRSGLRVGRDHLASTVYTVAFAYAGAALPTLVLLQVADPSLLDAVGSSAIAEEVVRTAVGGACVALAVPLTTAVAAATMARASVGSGARGRRLAGQ